jgi:hypothetical protein
MGTYSKIILSGSTDGEGLRLTVTAPSTGLVVHTCVTGAAQSIDELWLYAHSTVSTEIELSYALGPTTATGSRVRHTITADQKRGQILIIPGLVGRNAKEWKCWVTTTDRVNLFGYVNRYAS